VRPLLVIALSTACLALSSACGGSEPTMSGLPYSPFAHEDEPFAQELFEEQANLPQVEDEELLFVPGDLDGTYTHVEHFERRSWSSGESGPTVWFFGGSTLFGIGQRDEHTIASEVARLAADAGTPVRVATFGFPSYLAWQEVGLLRRVLSQRPRPGLVVFYHGVNDLAAICKQLALGATPDGRGNPLFEEQPEDPEVDCKEDPEATGRLLAASVSRAVTDARAAAAPAPVVEFWQPFLATRRHVPSDAPLLERLGTTEEVRRSQHPPYVAAIAAREDEAPIDLLDALDAHDGPVYFDWAHTNERGARLIAEAMWRRGLRDAVAGLHGASSNNGSR
jgi:hypothetical protein